MWKLVCQSVQGTSHQRSGLPCQDSCTACEARLAEGTALVLACSDGAGSAAHSDLGSQVACDTIVQAIADDLHADGPAAVSLDRAAHWVAGVHRSLAIEADVRGVETRQLACTLLFAVLLPRGAFFGQIGDGAIVVWENGRYKPVFWPQSGEYANTTNFVIDPRYESLVEFAWCDGPLDEVALLSDGLQMLALDFVKREAHGPFFAPMFQSLRRESCPEALAAPLCAFLDSPGVCDRTDDDKTLILATRVAG
jgi:hypothetical protein